ncbi:MAG TPA: hypothetical protein VEZ14_00305, partial [Dehalococcoidia bacterium]|nr:hypothetical protein [Dehalococcoidia bacterium]
MKRSTQIVIGGIALVVVAAAAVVTIALNSGATKRSSNAEAQANPTLPPIVPIGTLVANILSQKTPPATLLTAISQPPPAVTHVPEGYANTINDAIRLIGPLFAGEAGSVSSVRIDHVNYVETTAGQAFTLFAPSYLARLSSYNLTSSTPVWAFVVRGAFHQAAEEAGRIVPPAGAVTVFPEMWGIVPEGSYRFTLGSISSQNPDLTTLGTPVEVMPGQDSEIDRVRAPLMIAVGAPSLVSGAVQVPIDAANPFNASLVPYTGVNVHLRWNPA